jgi:CRP-like cAMP-binding protein/SAM-dependent methyltransferase
VTLPTHSMHSGLAVLSRLSGQDIDWILDFGTETELAPEAILLSEGSRPDAISLIVRGIMQVFLGSDSKNPIAILGPGQLVGEMSFLEDRPASASVAAVEPTTIISLPTLLLQSKLDNDPQFAARLRELLGEFRRWIQDTPPTILASNVRSLELAEATQKCKERLLSAEREKKLQTEDALSLELREFASLMNRIVGPDSSENVDLRDELGARVKRELLPLLGKCELANRLYSKPRGYDLDYETMELIGDEPRAEECPALSTALRQLPSLAGLWNRERLLADVLLDRAAARKNESVRCAMLADHSGNTVLSALARVDDSDRFEVSLVDFDKKALIHVTQRAAISGLAGRFACIDAHLLALTAGRFECGARSPDIVCCGGLADTLDESFLLRVIDRIYDLLSPGGCLIMGFYAKGQPDWSLLHYVLDVALIQHTEGEVNRLFGHSKFQSAATRVRYELEHACFVAECMK